MSPEPELEQARRRLLEEIAEEVRATRNWTGRERLSARVMAALGDVPREDYVAGRDRYRAYLNRPLPIGSGQTISQPFIVALMTDMLDPEPTDRVLEVGTGCGYQTAVLARLVAKVYSIEVVATLAETARARLAEQGCTNAEVRLGDGFEGWPEEAPFDGIIVTAAPERIPAKLVEQLAPGGRLVMPIGRAGDTQQLLRGVKDAQGRFTTQAGLPVAFVPMVPGPSDGPAS